jgi:hypothetical protein
MVRNMAKIILILIMASLNKFLSEARGVLSETKEKKKGGGVKNQQNGHSFVLQFSVQYAIVGKISSYVNPPPPRH